MIVQRILAKLKMGQRRGSQIAELRGDIDRLAAQVAAIESRVNASAMAAGRFSYTPRREDEQ